MPYLELYIFSKLKRDSTPNMEAVLETDLLLQQKEAEVSTAELLVNLYPAADSNEERTVSEPEHEKSTL